MSIGAGLCCAAAPASTVPSDSNFKAHPEWNQGCVERLAAMQGKPCDMIFIGDSITHMWTSPGDKVWAHYYGNRRALNFGAGGDKTQNVLWRLENWTVRGFRPKVAVVLIGTNNIGADSTDDIVAGVKAVTGKAQELFPGVRVILVGLFPRAEHSGDAGAVNAKLAELADGRRIFFLDAGVGMTPQGDTWKGLGPDRLHLSEEGYQIWAAAMEPLLSRLLGQEPVAPPAP